MTTTDPTGVPAPLFACPICHPTPCIVVESTDESKAQHDVDGSLLWRDPVLAIRYACGARLTCRWPTQWAHNTGGRLR